MKNLYLVLGNYDIDPKVRGGNLLLKPGLLIYLCCLVSGVFFLLLTVRPHSISFTGAQV